MSNYTDEEQLDNQSDAKSENPPNEIFPSNQTETITQNQETENMEVHHHAHHHEGKRKWKSYLWEFLMLFLAVFCGFLAEYQLEHKIEKDRTREYARQMVQDLKTDTLLLKKFSTAINLHITSFDTVNSLFDVSPPVSNYRLLSALLPQRSTYPIHLINTTFNQMKYSGTIRYFNSELGEVVSEYYDHTHKFTQVAIDYVDNFFTTEVQTFMLNHFDYNQSDFYTDTLKVSNPTFIDRSAKTDMLLRNRFILYTQLLRFIKDFPLKETLNQAVKVIDLLKKEYNLD